jgi:hypothetical protein
MVLERFIRLSVSNVNLAISLHSLTQVTLVPTLALPETILLIARSVAHLAH